MNDLHPMFFLGGALLVLVIALFYLFTLVLDWLLIHENEPQSLWSARFLAFVASDIRLRITRFAQRWVANGKTWSRSVWWIGFCLAGGFAIAVWIGGTEYLQSWAASVFRGCSGAVVGFLVSRFLLRINVSDIASRYPAGSEAQAIAASRGLLSSAVVVGAGVIAVSVGM